MKYPCITVLRIAIILVLLHMWISTAQKAESGWTLDATVTGVFTGIIAVVASTRRIGQRLIVSAVAAAASFTAWHEYRHLSGHNWLLVLAIVISCATVLWLARRCQSRLDRPGRR